MKKLIALIVLGFLNNQIFSQARAYILEINSDGKVDVQSANEWDLGMGWTSFEYYYIQNQAYLLRHSTNNGHTLLYKIDGKKATKLTREPLKWSKNSWVSFETFTIDNSTYLYQWAKTTQRTLLKKFNSNGLLGQNLIDNRNIYFHNRWALFFSTGQENYFLVHEDLKNPSCGFLGIKCFLRSRIIYKEGTSYSVFKISNNGRIEHSFIQKFKNIANERELVETYKINDQNYFIEYNSSLAKGSIKRIESSGKVNHMKLIELGNQIKTFQVFYINDVPYLLIYEANGNLSTRKIKIDGSLEMPIFTVNIGKHWDIVKVYKSQNKNYVLIYNGKESKNIAPNQKICSQDVVTIKSQDKYNDSNCEKNQRQALAPNSSFYIKARDHCNSKNQIIDWKLTKNTLICNSWYNKSINARSVLMQAKVSCLCKRIEPERRIGRDL